MSENERVKQLRKELNLTLEKFSARLGVTQMAISNIERGNRRLTDQMFKLICKEFNVSPDWLKTGEGEMFLTDKVEEEDDEIVRALVKIKYREDLGEDHSRQKDVARLILEMDDAEFDVFNGLLQKIARLYGQE